MKRLEKHFYQGGTVELAPKLLGKILISEKEEGQVGGRIVEVEAYLHENDPACHASRGKTARNAVMFGPAGVAYVYLIYGIYHCFNVVSGREGAGEAVLVRALEPLWGLELMSGRRKTREKRLLTRGPGRLCQALDIDGRYNGADLYNRELYLADDGSTAGEIIQTSRVGISVAVDLPLRFYLAGNPYVSRK